MTSSTERKLGVILTYITVGAQAIISFVYVRLLLYYMGQSEYGLYQTMGSFVAYFAIMDFGLSSTIIRFYSRYRVLGDRKSMDNVLSLSAIIYSIIAVVILIIGTVLYFKLDVVFGQSFTPTELISARKIFIVLLINIAVSLFSKVFDAIITSYEKFVFMKTMTLIQTIFQPFVVIAVMRVSSTALAMVIVQTTFNLVLIALKIYFTYNKLKIRFRLHFLDKNLLIEMLKFSFFIFLTAAMDQIFWQSNKVILGIIASTSVVAIYGVASQIMWAYSSFSAACGGVFMPRVTYLVTKHETESQVSDLFIKIGRLQYLLASCILTGFVAFGKIFIKTITGLDDTQVTEIYIITLCLIIPYSIDLIQNIGTAVMQAKNKISFRALVFLALAVISVGTSVFLGKRYGAMGCAFATGSCYFIANIAFLNPYYSIVIKLNVSAFWKEILKISVPAVVCMGIGVGINQVLNFPVGIIDLGLKIIVYLGIFSFVMWLLAMNEYEKGLIKGLKKKILGFLHARKSFH